MKPPIILSVTLALGVLAGVASAQPAPGPVQCYARATGTERVSRFDAIHLCIGAISDAPARCYGAASSSLDLSNSERVHLCAMATSTEPVSCAARVNTTPDRGTSSVASSCASPDWATTMPLPRGSQACVGTVLAQTPLSDQDADHLCRGSQSAAPLACFNWGKARLDLSNADLILLCAAVVPSP